MKERITIGLLVEVTSGLGGYQTALWRGAVAGARALNANLVCFAGGALIFSPRTKDEPSRNDVYRLVSQKYLDGLVISGSLGSFVPRQQFVEFCDQFRHIPMITTAVSIPGIPAVLDDNSTGMRALVAHLVEKHGYRRFAYIGGPRDNLEAQERFAAYRAVLHEHGISFNERTVYDGDFFPASGATAIRKLLETQGPDIEAIVAANDNMALGAIQALRDRGLRVPEDIAVVGFDDIEDEMSAQPFLTTVRHSVYTQGKRAVEILVGGRQKDLANITETLPTKLILRRSCRCSTESLLKRHPLPAGSSNLTYGDLDRRAGLGEISNALGERVVESHPEIPENLFDAFLHGLHDDDHASFPRLLDEAIKDTTLSSVDLFAWSRALGALRRLALDKLADRKAGRRAVRMLRDAENRIRENAWEIQLLRGLTMERRTESTNRITDELWPINSRDDLGQALRDALPELGINTYYLAEYENMEGGREGCRVVAANDRTIGACHPKTGDQFEGSDPLLERCLAERHAFSAVVEPLFLKNEHSGFALLEADASDPTIFETLQARLSGALWSVHQAEKHQRLSQDERSLRQNMQQIVSGLRLSEVADKIVDAAWRLTQAERATLQLVRGDYRSMVACRGYEIKTANPWLNRKISGDALIQKIVATQEPLVLSDTKDDPLWVRCEDTKEVNSWMCVPLVYAGEVVALLILDHNRSAHFNKSHADALAGFTAQAASELLKAHLYHISEQRIEHLEAVNQAAQRMAQQLGEEDLIETVADVIFRQFEGASCYVFDTRATSNEGSGKLVAGRGPHGFDTLSRVASARKLAAEAQTGSKTVIAAGPIGESPSPSPRLSEAIGGALAVPLNLTGESGGVIIVTHPDSRYFDESKQILVEALALQAAITLERNIGLRLLGNINKRIVTLGDVAEILEAIIEGAVRLTHTVTGVIYLVDDSEKLLATKSWPKNFYHPPPRLSLNGGITQEVLKSRQKLVIPDTHKDARVNSEVRSRYGSLVAVPLLRDERSIGVFFVNDLVPREFQQMELSMLVTLAGQAAIAIEKARLLEEKEREIQKVRSLLNEQQQTTKVQSRLIDLMADTRPSASIDELLISFIDEIQHWKGVEKLTIVERGATGGYDFGAIEFLNLEQREKAKTTEWVAIKTPLALTDDLQVFPVVLGDSESAFIVVKLQTDQEHATTLQWLEMARLIIQYQHEIGELLAKTEQLQKFHEARQTREFVGAVSRLYLHEVTNGLKAVESWISTAPMGIPNIELLRRRVEQMAARVSEVMSATDFSKVHRSVCVFNDELDKTLKLFGFRHLKKYGGCTLELDVAGHRHRKVFVDPNSFAPILNNLILNAQEQYQLRTKQGPIKISIFEEAVGDEIHIGFDVLDYAIGIAEEHRQKIFEPGFSTKPNGSGLGLWIVQKLVEACGGDISVESTLGHFTKFRVSYPIIPE